MRCHERETRHLRSGENEAFYKSCRRKEKADEAESWTRQETNICLNDPDESRS